MAAADPRLGLAIEFYGLELVWRLNDEEKKFYKPAAATDAKVPVIEWDATQETNVDLPILVPLEPSPYEEGNVQWESLWGFHCVPNKVGSKADIHFTDKTTVSDVYFCNLEINSSAQSVGNHEFWIQFYLCTRKFLESILHFAEKDSPTATTRDPTNLQPLDVFVKWYNDLVDKVDLPAGFVDHRQLFKLQLSKKITDLAAGTDKHFKPARWKPWFKIARGGDQEYCPAKVNYQVELGWLGTKIDDFCRLWRHTWVWKFAWDRRQIDFNVIRSINQHDPRTVNVDDVYRTMQFAALWRIAGGCAVTLVSDAIAPQDIKLPEAQRDQIVGLLTYMLAVGSIHPDPSVGSPPKDTYPQLPKTSPAALADAIVTKDTSGTARKAFAALSEPKFVEKVALMVTTEVRNVDKWVSSGGLYQVTPQPGNTTLTETYDKATKTSSILSGGAPGADLTACPPNFEEMWKAALSLDDAKRTVATKFGYSPEAPFHVTWSADVHTAVPPTSGESAPLLAFESRYGNNVINIGWTPSSANYMFAKSYLPLVNALAHDQLDAATKAAQALGTDKVPGGGLEPELNLIDSWH